MATYANPQLNVWNQLHADQLHHEIDAYLKGYGSLKRLEKCLKTVPPGFRLKPFVAYEDWEVAAMDEKKEA